MVQNRGKSLTIYALETGINLYIMRFIHYIEEKNKEIVIIGAGDAAFDYALNLSSDNRVTILNRGSKIKALPLLFDRIQDNKAIRYLTNTEITGISKTTSGMLDISISGTSPERSIECDYLLAAIGREPEYSFADPSIIEQNR